MKKGHTDRRVERTQALLQDALLTLIEEKGYARVTVQDILDRANLGRSTFYLHYRDKDDLLVSTFERLKDLFEASAPPPHFGARASSPPGASLSLAFFRHAGQQQRLYKAIVGKRGGEIMQKHLYQYFSDLMRSHLDQRFPVAGDVAVPREVMVHYFVSSFLALLTWWLDRDMPYGAEQMDAMFNTLTMPGVKNALRRK